MDDLELRHEIYRTLAETGEAPSADSLAARAGGRAAVESALRRLHDAHALVLDDAGAIRMALPFSAVPTDHRVIAGSRSWWANCAWDTFGIPVALGIDVRIDARWLDSGEPVGIAISGGEPTATDGFVHFAVPARHWWDDIVET